MLERVYLSLIQKTLHLKRKKYIFFSVFQWVIIKSINLWYWILGSHVQSCLFTKEVQYNRKDSLWHSKMIYYFIVQTSWNLPKCSWDVVKLFLTFFKKNDQASCYKRVALIWGPMLVRGNKLQIELACLMMDKFFPLS